MSVPVPLQDRVVQSEAIVLGKLKSQESYWDEEHKWIYTLNILEVSAWLKGNSSAKEVGIITLGGVVGEKACESFPALQLAPYNEYVLFLDPESGDIDHKGMRADRPFLRQSLTYADAQGAITKQGGFYHDLYSEPRQTEADLFQKIETILGEKARRPDGSIFLPRSGDTFPLSEFAYAQASNKTAPITSFSPDPTHAGTIDSGDFITINGSGFGGTAGTIFYTNADDGGATLTASGVASDNLSWTDSQIENKPAGNGGTGPINVNGSISSGSDLTIEWAHTEINSSFAGFGSTTRQAWNLIDQNGTGGYTLTYNTSFAANVPATAAFERALETWVCATQVNMEMDGSTSPNSSVANDGVNLVFFNGSLPAGVLGRANSSFSASATGACNQTNTVWFLQGIDIEYTPTPGGGGFTWNFGPGATGFSEFDFESVSVHELGHAHGMGHIISSGEVMHFSISNGSDTRVLSANDIAGGLAKMAYSTTPFCFNPSGVNGPMVALVGAGCAPLPIGSLVLSGEKTNAGNQLTWEWENSLEFRNFNIERSEDGIEFTELAPQQIPSDQKTNLGSFLDLSPSGNFYRITGILADGRQMHSNTIEIVRADGLDLRIYPQPARDHLTLELGIEIDTPLQFTLFDLQGRAILNRDIQAQAGNNLIQINELRLPSGLYLYRLTGTGISEKGKVLLTQ